jgi:hypothetical protein
VDLLDDLHLDKAALLHFVVTEACAKGSLAILAVFLGAGFSLGFARFTGKALAGLGSRLMAKAKDAEPKASPNRIDEILRDCKVLTI